MFRFISVFRAAELLLITINTFLGNPVIIYIEYACFVWEACFSSIALTMNHDNFKNQEMK